MPSMLSRTVLFESAFSLQGLDADGAGAVALRDNVSTKLISRRLLIEQFLKENVRSM